MPPAVELHAVTKRYAEVTALDALDLTVPEGSVYGFLGPNGAGKTTAMKILTALTDATGGEARIAGYPAAGGEAVRRGLVGYLDQAPRFNGWLRGRELLELVGRLSGMRGADLAARVSEVLELVGLSDAGRRTIGGYSGGMRQRLGVAQALLARPPVILLDEPVSALDPEGRHDMLEMIRGLGGASTVLVSSHLLNDVERVCDHVAIIDHGRLVTDAPMADLLDRFAQPVYLLTAEPDATERVSGLATTIRSQAWISNVEVAAETIRVTLDESAPADAGHRLLALVVEAGVGLLDFERSRPTLEDVFLRLTAKSEPVAGGQVHGP
jgi:ABC-2 type transport system ATP-binding protein